jgi:hypothetical protein
MGAMTNLLVKDDAATRIEFTLIPITDTPNPRWRAAVAGVPVDGQLQVEAYEEVQASGERRRVLKVLEPVMETLGASGTSAGYVAPPKVAYRMSAFMSMIVNPRSTIADAANIHSLLLGLIQGASSTTATGTLTQASAGDAIKNSTAPIVRFLVYGELPF